MTTLLLEGLHFPECPRWHDGRLWFSDMHGHQVMAVDPRGRAEAVARLPTQPAGLGWTPDGRLLAVSMVDRRLLRLDGARWEEVADLAALASFRCNELLVDGRGRAYVGTFGFDLDGGAPYAPGEVILVEPGGAARVVAAGLRFPNGMVLSPGGGTLIVAESMGPALQAFDVAPDGSLGNARLWAPLTDVVPDGTCLDAEGAVWVASPVGSEVVRVTAGGGITQRVAVSNRAFACMLGGADRRTMFVLTADNSNPTYCRAHASGRIETFAVDVPGAGLP
ncbi:MAG TPA: SMP-30/gluconolactonase/LRE family protein [Candidatus Binatia bacterium]|nr:SMP-30/gluconolactonase/LRE family protein [Candidatus Binatia bacterium]